MRGICKGESSKILAAELELDDKTVLKLRLDIQANTEAERPEDPLPDEHSETDEMFQNAKKKVNFTRILLIRLALEPTSNVVMTPITMIDHRLSLQLVEKAVWCA